MTLHHDLISASLVFQQIGTEAGFATRRAAGTGRFVDPRPETAEADVYLFYTSGGQFGTEQQQALAEAVAGGKGLVVVHCSNILGWQGDGMDPADRPLFELLGNRYLSHGPGHHEGRHTIEIVADHPVTEPGRRPTSSCSTSTTSSSWPTTSVTVLAQRHRADGVIIPVMYAREVGAGRVVYLALGHDMRAWGEPPFRALVRQALAWASGLSGDA